MPTVIPLGPHDPRRIGRYRLTGRIDDLGAATVGSLGAYAAKRTDGQAVTLTLLGGDRAVDAAARDRFTAEARAARRVPPFCAARILDAGFEGNRPYLVAEFVPGPTLAEVVSAGGPLPAGAVLGVAAGTATGLAAIHQAGLVHGRLAPQTVVLSPEGPRVVHFSITPPYGSATPAADMLAWAQTVLYAAAAPPAAGVRPRGLPALGPGGVGGPRYGRRDLALLPDDLRALVADCLSPDPAGRPAARAVLTALLRRHDVSAGLLAEGARLARTAARPQAAGQPAGGGGPTPADRPARRRRAAAIGWATAGAVCVAAIAAAAAYLTHRHPATAASGSPTPSHSAPTLMSRGVPAGFTGTWSGTVHQRHPVLSVSVRLSLHGSGGTVAYPQLGCTGSLAVNSAAPGTLVLDQRIRTGSNNCEDGVVTLTQQGGKLLFKFGRSGGSSPAGTLTRQH